MIVASKKHLFIEKISNLISCVCLQRKKLSNYFSLFSLPLFLSPFAWSLCFQAAVSFQIHLTCMSPLLRDSRLLIHSGLLSILVILSWTSLDTSIFGYFALGFGSPCFANLILEEAAQLFFSSSIKNFNSDLLLYMWAGLTTEKQARPIYLFCSLDWLRPKPENPKINSMAWLRFRFSLSVLVFVPMFFTCTPSKKSKQMNE